MSQTSCYSVAGLITTSINPVPLDGINYTFSLSGTTCTIAKFPKCDFVLGPDCYYGDTAPYNSTSASCPSGFTYTGTGTSCYATKGSTCFVGSYDSSSDKCKQPAQEECPPKYTRIGGTSICDSTVSIANATSPKDCVNSTTSRSECQWCSATNVCVLNSVTCPSSCATAPQEVCSLPPTVGGVLVRCSRLIAFNP